MALTNQQLTDKIAALETAVKELATGINNLASKNQLKSLVNIRQSEIIDLQNRVSTLETQIDSLT